MTGAGERGGAEVPPLDDHRPGATTRRLVAYRAALAEEMARAGRSVADVHLIAVTKYHSAALAAELVAAGQLDLGENTLQGLRGKLAEPGLEAVRWHFLGRLQRNKATAVARVATCIHSIDRPELVDHLDRVELDRPVDAFVQVSLDGDPTRGGVAVAGLEPLAERVAASRHLRLRGIMAVAPVGADADAAFARVRELAEVVRGVDPAATAISAGMSGDWRAAVRHGATHLRIGTAITGVPETHR